MSCAPGQPTFRLLDPRIGWEPASAEGLSGLDGEAELRLAPVTGTPGEDPAAVVAVFGDPRVARGCGPCEWLLLGSDRRRPLLRLRCPDRSGAEPVWAPRDAPHLLEPVAVSARGHVLAVADRILRRVLVWDGGGTHLIARLGLDADPVAVALTPWGEVLVAVSTGQIRRFGLHGDARPQPRWRVRDLPGPVIGFAFGRPGTAAAPEFGAVCALVLLVRDRDGALSMWRAERDRPELAQITIADALALAGPSGVLAVGEQGFCVEPHQDDLQASPDPCCWRWDGEPVDGSGIAAPVSQPLETAGQLLTRAIDSGIARCQWHRMRVDAQVPPGTTLQLAVVSSEQGDDQPAKGAENDPHWAGFATGTPHPDEWEELPPGAADVLLRQPPGRYLFVRVRLTGDGVSTPVVHGIRLDLPRRTSLRHLPEVWQDEPVAADFTARFLSLFDAQLDDLDRVIERYPALMDSAHVPDAVLPWLAGLLGVGFDPGWPAAQRRAVLQAAPELYRLRGTPAGLRLAIRLVFGVDPVIEELAATRAWGALARPGTRVRAVLGAVRLFGSSRVRFRLDRSSLSRTPIRGFGDPRLDAQSAGAYRFRVLLPPSSAGAVDVPGLRRLIGTQAPAHTVATVRVGGTGLVVGQQSAVGVDTLLTGPPAPVLGGTCAPVPTGRGARVQLNRATVLWPGPRHNSAIRAGDRSVVGVNTVVR